MLLRVENIHFKYPGGVEVLKGVTFSADRGEVVAIIGPNGSGKTTLLMITAGLLKPAMGIILLEDKPLREQLPEIHRRIGLVFQDPDDQLFNPTVYDEMAFALRQLLSSEEEVSIRVREISEKFNLKGLLSNPPYKLSMGEKRMVTLASILAYDPDILLLDEPTANLSTGTIERIKQIVVNAKDANKAVVIASHDVDFIAEVSDRVYIINEGSMLGGLEAKAILSDEALLALADMRPPLVLQTVRLLGAKLYGTPLTIEDIRKLRS